MERGWKMSRAVDQVDPWSLMTGTGSRQVTCRRSGGGLLASMRIVANGREL